MSLVHKKVGVTADDPSAEINKTQWNDLHRYAVRIITAAGAVTVTTADGYVAINKTVGGATTVNLPPSPVAGDAYVIKDKKGDSATNNITLTPNSGTIDGASTFVMATNYMSILLIYDGVEWGVN